MGGIAWSIYGVGQAFSNTGGSSPPRFRVAMKGYNKEILLEQAMIFADSLLVHPRIHEVNTEANLDYWQRDRHEYFLQLNREKMAETGINPRHLVTIMEPFNRFRPASLYTRDKIPIRMDYQTDGTRDMWTLRHRAFPIDSHQVSIGDLTSIERRKASQAIHKEDQQYIRMVEFEYTGSNHFGSRYLEATMNKMKKSMPLGYSMDHRRYSFWRAEEKQKIWLLLLVMGMILFICTIHFESIRQALAIVVLIPSSFIGIFLTFYWFDLSFDQGGYTSFILLSGLTVNSMILLINDYNLFRKRFPHRSPMQHYLKAFQHKFTPIFLTIFSTALGLIPFLMAGDSEVFWFALAAGTIGGLV